MRQLFLVIGWDDAMHNGKYFSLQAKLIMECNNLKDAIEAMENSINKFDYIELKIVYNNA